MRSYVTNGFRKLFAELPPHIRSRARTGYRLWAEHPGHPSLQFKRVHPSRPIYSVRIGIGWRVLGVVEDEAIIWFWIGSHAGYDKMLRRL